MSTTLIGLIIAGAAAVFFFIGGGRRFWWLILPAILFTALGLYGDAIFKYGKQSAFEALPISPLAQAQAVNILGLLGAGAVCAFVLRLALSFAVRTPPEKK